MKTVDDDIDDYFEDDVKHPERGVFDLNEEPDLDGGEELDTF